MLGKSHTTIETQGKDKGKHQDSDAPIDDNPIGEDVETEQEKGIPFGAVGATVLTNVLQYALLVGLSMVILIIMRLFMPANMFGP